MYIIEILAKLILNRKNKKNSQNIDEADNCKHLYIAIDNDKDYLACMHCGNVIKNRPDLFNSIENKDI